MNVLDFTKENYRKMDETNTAKVVSMVLLGAISVLLGFLPYIVGPRLINNQKGWKKTLTSAMLVFGGGVLFATSMIHMFPEVSLKSQCI